jgi:hypothetical protein
MVGEHADTLRALGRYLDGVAATEVTVIEQLADLGVVWQDSRPGRETRAFGPGQLHALRLTAHLHRGLERSAPRFTMAELLSTLGTMVDEANGSGIMITETSTGFRLSARTADAELARTVSYS